MTVTEVADGAYGAYGASGAVPGRGRKSLELVGRDQDMRIIQEFVDGLPAQGGTLLLSGEPGVGKSALLNAAGETATTAGIRVLRASGAEFEDQSFSALNQLLLPLRGELNRLEGLHPDALNIALGFSDGLARDLLVVSNAVLALLGHVAADCPLLVIVDNLQWADRASAVVLGSVARRLPGSQVGLLAAASRHLGRAGRPRRCGRRSARRRPPHRPGRGGHAPRRRRGTPVPRPVRPGPRRPRPGPAGRRLGSPASHLRAQRPRPQPPQHVRRHRGSRRGRRPHRPPRRPGPTAPAANCAPPAKPAATAPPGPPTSSPPRNSRSPGSPPRACPTARSDSASTSPTAPSNPRGSGRRAGPAQAKQ